MIESLVMCLSADPEQRVRAHLTKAPKYSVKYWWARKNYDAIQKYRNEHPEAREQEDRKILVEKILPSNWDTDRKEQEIELYNEYMSGMEKDFYQECPQYIFSYTDCIYTVTSEFSAHGKNDRTTDDLSIDGWEALLSGMLQIMQWVADKNPNS